MIICIQNDFSRDGFDVIQYSEELGLRKLYLRNMCWPCMSKIVKKASMYF